MSVQPFRRRFALPYLEGSPQRWLRLRASHGLRERENCKGKVYIRPTASGLYDNEYVVVDTFRTGQVNRLAAVITWKGISALLSGSKP